MICDEHKSQFNAVAQLGMLATFVCEKQRGFADFAESVALPRAGPGFAPGRTRMLARFWACWLVFLILLPFSAPFSTCDPSVLFPAAQGVGAAGDGATSHALPAGRIGNQVRFLIASQLYSRAVVGEHNSPRAVQGSTTPYGASSRLAHPPLRI